MTLIRKGRDLSCSQFLIGGLFIRLMLEFVNVKQLNIIFLLAESLTHCSLLLASLETVQ